MCCAGALSTKLVKSCILVYIVRVYRYLVYEVCILYVLTQSPVLDSFRTCRRQQNTERTINISYLVWDMAVQSRTVSTV